MGRKFIFYLIKRGVSARKRAACYQLGFRKHNAKFLSFVTDIKNKGHNVIVLQVFGPYVWEQNSEITSLFVVQVFIHVCQELKV